jgi:hypothetical protein
MGVVVEDVADVALRVASQGSFHMPHDCQQIAGTVLLFLLIMPLSAALAVLVAAVAVAVDCRCCCCCDPFAAIG